VAREKTIVDVLAELPTDDLARMRQKNQRDLNRAKAEVSRLELQEQQLELAVARRERGKPGRPGALTSDLVLDAAGETEAPVTAAAVQATLASRGVKATVNAVRNHLNRLVQSGDLDKDEKGRYSPPAPVFVPDFVPSSAADFPAAADDDIPF
jgi:hypothetical protein